MKIECIHGYFKFFDDEPGDVARFMKIFDVELERSVDHFTFSDLVEAPRFSIKGGEYLDALATETYEGDPWDVMRANGLVYDFVNGLVVQKTLITSRAKILSADYFFMASGMLRAGAIMDDGTRVTDYSAHFSLDYLDFKYSEVSSG